VTKKTNNSGFTLVEMLVVITIIALMGLMIIPAIIGMFSSGADSQSYSMLTTELSAARSLALKTSSYVCVHIQQADQVSDPTIPASINSKVYMSILVRHPFLYTIAGGVSGTDCSFYPDQVFAIGQVTAYNSGSSAVTALLPPENSLAYLQVNPPFNNGLWDGGWVKNQWSGYWVRMISGNATGQTSQICAASVPYITNGNPPPATVQDPTILALTAGFAATPAAGDYYMIYKPTNVEPQVLPGTIAFGRLVVPTINNNTNGNFIVNGVFQGTALGDLTTDAGNNMLAQSFMTVNIIFSPSGTLVTTTPDFNGCAYLATAIPGTAIPLPGCFYDTYTDPNSGGYKSSAAVQSKIWPMPSSSGAAVAVYGNGKVPTAVNNYDGVNLPQPGTSAVTIVDYMKFGRLTGTANAPNGPNRYTYLYSDNGGCPYLPINTNIGQMLPRK
jgi:prepilin-type N-terminal cleavage/methylation domain-containing protein